MDRTGVTKVFSVYLDIAHLNLYENIYSGVFEVADNKSAVDFQNSKRRIQNDGKLLINLPFFSKFDVNRYENVYPEVFGVADYESVVRFSKFKMANPIWRKIFDKFDYHHENVYSGFFFYSVVLLLNLL